MSVKRVGEGIYSKDKGKGRAPAPSEVIDVDVDVNGDGDNDLAPTTTQSGPSRSKSPPVDTLVPQNSDFDAMFGIEPSGSATMTEPEVAEEQATTISQDVLSSEAVPRSPPQALLSRSVNRRMVSFY